MRKTLILIDGGPASGKNTLGNLLVNKLDKYGIKSILLDLDHYVEEFCPNWIWKDKKKKQKDMFNARKNFLRDINKYLIKGIHVIAIGERFLKKSDVARYSNKLKIEGNMFLFHLDVPLNLRRKRLKSRGPHSLIDLDRDQKERDKIKIWPGHVYRNLSSPEIDASNLMKLIKNKNGLIN